ncbi:MAG TPA: hypothetical protein VM266_10495, partial [Solirubrobacteraceae bacterium]|nr:hypothetical protein [Solirubrobacteraceae bacterium]
MEAAQQRLDEHEERHDAREGVARQAERPAITGAPAEERLAWLHAHAPEQLLDAGGGEGALDVVVLADRNAAGDEQHVGFGQPAAHARQRLARLVGRRAEVERLGAGARGQRAQRDAARLVDLSRPER